MKSGGGAGNRIAGDRIARDTTGAIDAIGDDASAETPSRDATDRPARDDSETIRTNARSALVTALANAVRHGTETGDTRLVQVAVEALAGLVGTAEARATRGEVIDFISAWKKPWRR